MAKKTQFEVLLDVRETQRDDLEAKLADALSELERRRSFVQRKQRALEDVRAEIGELEERRDALLESASFQPRQLATLDSHGDSLAEQAREKEAALSRARKSVEEQQARCQEARAELAEAQKALEAVRKHYQKQRQKQELVAKRKQQTRNDEIASRRWWEENK